MNYELMTNEQLRHLICRRSYHDLYLDIYEIVRSVSRVGLLNVLQEMDVDDAAGRKGPLRQRFRFPWDQKD